MSDLAKRLRDRCYSSNDIDLAAEEIERLRAEVATLRHQLANALDSLKYECDQRLQIERRYCPCCGHEPVDGHNAACGLDACLGGRYE